MTDIEKEVEEYLDELTLNLGDIRQAYIAGAESREERIEELEKENAELKNKLEAMTTDRNRWMNVDEEDCGYLRKAKEIIKGLIQLVDCLNDNNVKEPLVCKAEDFIRGWL